MTFLAITGITLSLQDPLTAFAERSLVSLPGETTCLKTSDLVEKARLQTGKPGASLTLFSNPRTPALFTISTDTVYLMDACTGTLLQPRPSAARAFFSHVKDLHRWVAFGGSKHESLRAVKDAANLLFALLIVSGVVLWLPRQWRAANLRAAGLLRSDLKGRARDWNLHNVAGIWFAVPLLVISLTGTVMAYGWANNLLYRVAGSPLPKAAEDRAPNKPAKDLHFLDPMPGIASAKDSGWKAMMIRLPMEADKNVSLTIDDRLDNRPSGRNQLTLTHTGKIVRWEPFAALPRGRQWRLNARFLHSGDLLGVAGQVIADLAAAMLLLLVWTGVALSLRRFTAWRRRTARQQEKQALTAA